MKRVLITGATGFVGRQVLKRLVDMNMPTTIVTRTSNALNFDENDSDVRVIITEDAFAETEEWWENQCQGIDIIIHLAWYTEPGKYLEDSRNLKCFSGSINLAKGAAKAGVKRFVGIGSCFEYDTSEELLSTQTGLKPSSLYAAAKAGLYLNLKFWLPTQGVEFAWCRLFYLYGEGEDKRRLYPYVCEQLRKGNVVKLTSGNQIRDFLNVEVAGRQILEVALSTRHGAQNICSGIPLTVKEFVERIALPSGQQHLLKFGSRSDNKFDPPRVVGVPSL